MINYFIGFGIGSFLQGDKDGGRKGLVLDLCGLGLMGVGSIGILATEPPIAGFFVLEILAGSIVVVASKIYQMRRAWVFGDSGGFAVAPTIDGNGKPTVSAKWVYRY